MNNSNVNINENSTLTMKVPMGSGGIVTNHSNNPLAHLLNNHRNMGMGHFSFVSPSFFTNQISIINRNTSYLLKTNLANQTLSVSNGSDEINVNNCYTDNQASNKIHKTKNDKKNYFKYDSTQILKNSSSTEKQSDYKKKASETNENYTDSFKERFNGKETFKQIDEYKINSENEEQVTELDLSLRTKDMLKGSYEENDFNYLHDINDKEKKFHEQDNKKVEIFNNEFNIKKISSEKRSLNLKEETPLNDMVIEEDKKIKNSNNVQANEINLASQTHEESDKENDVEEEIFENDTEKEQLFSN